MEETREKRLAIVCSGGGMGCAYTGGALCALAKEHGIKAPEYIIAASGSAGSSLYYLLGQYAEIERIWKKHLSTSSFLSFSRLRKIMDIDYLIDVVLKKIEPVHTTSLSDIET